MDRFHKLWEIWTMFTLKSSPVSPLPPPIFTFYTAWYIRGWSTFLLGVSPPSFCYWCGWHGWACGCCGHDQNCQQDEWWVTISILPNISILPHPTTTNSTFSSCLKLPAMLPDYTMLIVSEITLMMERVWGPDAIWNLDSHKINGSYHYHYYWRNVRWYFKGISPHSLYKLCSYCLQTPNR